MKNPVLCLLEYNDGFRASVLMLGGLVNEYLVAFRVKGQQGTRQRQLLRPDREFQQLQPAGACHRATCI